MQPSDRTPPPAQSNLETVCHRRINTDPAYYPQAVHDGRVLYFCTQACLGAYELDPQRFLDVHGREDQ